MPVPLTISIDENLKKDLDALAEATHRSSDSLAMIALRMFVAQETKNVAGILEGMRQARAGETVCPMKRCARGWIHWGCILCQCPVPQGAPVNAGNLEQPLALRDERNMGVRCKGSCCLRSFAAQHHRIGSAAWSTRVAPRTSFYLSPR